MTGWTPTTYLIVAVAALAVFKYRHVLGAALVARVPAASPVVNVVDATAERAYASVLTGAVSLADSDLAVEFARRLKEQADKEHAQAVLEEMQKAAKARFTPVASALPIASAAHPAATLADAPIVPK